MRTEKQKGILSFLLAFVMVIGMLAGVCQTQNKAHAAEDFRLWRQNDERWGSYAIGGSTVRSSGCYITSIAMAAVASGAKTADDFDPGVFAEALNSIGAFNQWGGLSSWSSVNKVIPEVSIATANINFKSEEKDGKTSEIKEYLDKGLYVICNVGGHWVYIDGIKDGDVYMADPAKDEILMFEAYDNSNITMFQAIKGKEPYSGFTPLELPDKEDEFFETEFAVTERSQAAYLNAAVYSSGEYYNPDSIPVKVWADSSKNEAIALLDEGNIVDVQSVRNQTGQVVVGGQKGFVDLTELRYSGEPQTHQLGDVNNDGTVDAYDLALVNEYIDSLEKLPEGISVLTSSEAAAADINGDGLVNNSDVLLYLMLICD